MGKRIVNILLILVLAIQTLPIQEMGKMLFSNQFTEEIPHALDSNGEGSKSSPIKSDFISTADLDLSPAILLLSISHPVTIDAIPANHTGDIHVPPPNC